MESRALELPVYDFTQPCPYLPGRVARLPLRQPVRRLTGEEFDARLAAGDRRTGPMLYRTSCPHCQSCEPLRVEAARFLPNRSQRRAAVCGDRELRLEIGPPRSDPRRVELYNRHLVERGLGPESARTTPASYRAFLAETCCETIELSYWRGDVLAGAAIADRGAESLSAVYCYFDPDLSRLSPGTYSILKQLELCRDWGLRYLYLGLHVAGSPHVSYKALYLPHQRLIGGVWRAFERESTLRQPR